MLGAAAVGFWFYRLATFIPQPLDSANTLRPILNSWFIAYLKIFAQPEAGLAAWKSLCLVLLFVPPSLALLNFMRERDMIYLPDHATRALCSRTLLFASIAICLTACRYPSFLTYQLNPDEGEFLSAAHKLFWDSNFFRSVDTGSSGPLNIFALTLPAVFGLSPDYASSRALVLIFVFFDIYLLYRTVRLLAPDSVARVAIVPAVAAFAAFRNPNFLHYSSEEAPVVIVSTALFTSVSILARPSVHRMRLIFLGVLASAAFFTKMQSVPVVVAISAVAIAYTHASGYARRFWRPAALFSAGVLPLLVLNAALCWTGGVWRDFWMSYIVANQRYAEMPTSFLWGLHNFVQFLIAVAEVRLFLFAFLAVGVGFVIQRMRSDRDSEQGAFLQLCLASAIVIAAADRLQSPDASIIRSYVALFTLITVPLYFLLFYRARRFGADPVRWFGLLSTLSIAAALVSVYKPHRPFAHYLLLLYMPVFAAMAWMLIRQVPSEMRHDTIAMPGNFRGFRLVAPFSFVFLFVVLAAINAAAVWMSDADPGYYDSVIATVKPPEGDFIRSITRPDGHIAVWGWTADPYLGSGRVAATRDPNIGYLFFVPPDVTSYYRARFLQDLRENPPDLIVDATGPTSWVVFWDRTPYGFEQLPGIGEFVATYYSHFADGYGQRYHLRRDLAVKNRSIPLPRNCAPKAVRCVDTPLRTTNVGDGQERDVTATLPKVDLPAHALIEMQFTPAAVQTANATLFNNEAVPFGNRGFQFQSIGGDRYRLIVGLGAHSAFSKPIFLPSGKQDFISIEIKNRDVTIRANGVAVDGMHLPEPMVDSSGPVTLGSWVDGRRRFWGTIQFFQIVDLDRKTGTS